MKYSPIFIIGAARSGTNVLRDTLSSQSGMITWPCDEINLIFRHGNKSVKHDEFSEQLATSEVKEYIKGKFTKLSLKSPESVILEKTCANSLRIPFLNEIFPHARFIFIVRNGYDVTASSTKRWKSSIEISYLFKKLRFVPVSDIPYYAGKFINNRFKQLNSKEKQLAVWGPVYDGMKDDLSKLSLEQVCAKQWARCVEKAYHDLSLIDKSRVYCMNYESFVNAPEKYIYSIRDWLGESWPDELILESVERVKGSSVGKGQKKLNEKNEVKNIIEPVMDEIYHEIER